MALFGQTLGKNAQHFVGRDSGASLNGDWPFFAEKGTFINSNREFIERNTILHFW